MFSGRGDNGSRRGNSLLRFAGQEDPRARAAGTYVSLGAPAPAPTAADIHRKARSRRERVENAYLAELANTPETPAPSEPPRPARAPAPQAKTAEPSVLDQFARIDAVLAGRGRKRPEHFEEEMADEAHGDRASAPDDSGSQAWRPLIDPRHIISSVLSWKTPILGLGLLGALLGTLVALSTPKLYYASAEIAIDPRGLKVIDNGVNPDGFLSDTFAIVDSQVRVMTSPEVLETVVDKLHLEADTEFNGELKSSWLSVITGILRMRDAESDKSLAAADYLSNHVFVERGQKTYVVNVTSASTDPEKAAAIANKLVAVYVEKQRDQQSATVQQTTDELSKRLAALKESVEKSEQAVESYKAEYDLIGVEGRLIDDEAILRVNDQLAAARGQTINLNARAKSIKDLTPENVVGGGLPEEVNSPVLTSLRSQYSAAKQKRDGMATSLGPRHPERIQAESELESLRAGIAAEIRRVSASMQSDLRRAIQTEQDLAAHLAALKVKQGGSGADLVKLRELQRDASAKAQVYEAFKLRAMQTAEQVNLNTADIRVVVSARPPKEPLGISRKLIVLAGLLGGLGLGLGLAILKGIMASIGSQMDAGAAPRDPAPRPAPGGGQGGMFQPRQDRAARPASAEPAPHRMTPQHVQRLAEAFASASAPVQEKQQVPAAQPLERFRVYPQPVPQAAQPIPQPAPPQMAQPAPQPMPYWQPQPQMPLQGFVPPGPMMYPQQAFAPQPAFVPHQMYAPQPPAMPHWAQPAPYFAFHQPVHLQMPAASMPPQPQFYAPPPPPVPQPVAAVPAAQHPFAQEAEQPRPASAEPPVPPRAPAGDHLSQIQESIDEFRSALTSFAKHRRAS
jgi:polysaccharide biosynthesis transport protein